MSDRLGNVLGNFIGNRRQSGNRSLTKEFGQRVIARYPGMGEYISRSLFGSAGRESQIQYSLQEMEKLQSMNSHSGSGLISGTSGSRWPIAPLYDYLLTLDQTVGDILNEIDRIKSLGLLGSSHQDQVADRVLMPDFRPMWYHVAMELGSIDGQGNIMTEGQALGSDMYYESGQGGWVLPSANVAGGAHVRRKTSYELACDNALLLGYSHLNAIVALSQGLFRVQFTAAKKLNATSATSYGGQIERGNWINSASNSTDGQNPDALSSSNDRNRTLVAQRTDLGSYYQNRFHREHAIGQTATPFEHRNQGNVASPYNSPLSGGAMATLVTWRSGGTNTLPAGNSGGVPTQAIHVSSDMFRTAFHAHPNHPIQYCQTFKEVAKSLRIDLALRNLHMDMQVMFADMWAATRRSASNPSDHHAMSMRTGCPGGSVKVFKNHKGRMISEFINVPGRGTIRNPEIHGTGTCAPLVRNQSRAPSLVPGLSARAGLFNMGGPMSTPFSSESFFGAGASTSSIGELFGAEAKRRKPRKTAKKKPRKRKTAKKKPRKRKTNTRTVHRKRKVTRTSRMFKGRAVYRGEQGGLFVRTKAASGKLVRRYI